MSLIDSYTKVKPSIIAFCAKYSEDPKYGEPGGFPHIIGTGFIIDSCGLILTNQHVVDEFKKQVRLNQDSKYLDSVGVVLFETSNKQIKYPGFEILSHTTITSHIARDDFFDKEPPDIALVGVKVKDLPSCTIQNSPNYLVEGREIGTAGFPMGSQGLVDTSSGKVKQLSPTLQRGIICAIQPWAVDNPVSFTINVLVQGGASGSPVFDSQTGEVIGIVSARLIEPRPAGIFDGQGRPIVDEEGTPLSAWVQHPTTFSLVQPVYLFANEIEKLKTAFINEFGTQQISLNEYYSGRRPFDFMRGIPRD